MKASRCFMKDAKTGAPTSEQAICEAMAVNVISISTFAMACDVEPVVLPPLAAVEEPAAGSAT
eukprot:592627-Pyramimonas_sp.AAC.2